MPGGGRDVGGALTGLDRYGEVIGLGGKEYRAAIKAAFDGMAVTLTFPLAGLPIGKAMSATKRSAVQ